MYRYKLFLLLSCCLLLVKFIWDRKKIKEAISFPFFPILPYNNNKRYLKILIVEIMAKTNYNPLKANRAAHRKALMSAGLYNIHKEKVVPSGKAYKRKQRTGKACLEY